MCQPRESGARNRAQACFYRLPGPRKIPVLPRGGLLGTCVCGYGTYLNEIPFILVKMVRSLRWKTGLRKGKSKVREMRCVVPSSPIGVNA